MFCFGNTHLNFYKDTLGISKTVLLNTHNILFKTRMRVIQNPHYQNPHCGVTENPHFNVIKNTLAKPTLHDLNPHAGLTQTHMRVQKSHILKTHIIV